MKVLYEDNHLLVVDKPINIPMQEDESKDNDLLSMGKQYIKENELEQVKKVVKAGFEWDSVESLKDCIKSEYKVSFCGI